MPISGLAITLNSDDALAQASVAALADHACITIGQREGHRLPIVVETASEEEDRDVWQWLHSLPGVQFVDVACVHFDDNQDGSNQPVNLAEGFQEQ